MASPISLTPMDAIAPARLHQRESVETWVAVGRSGSVDQNGTEPVTALPPFELGYPRTELRRKLVNAALREEKTATSSLRVEYEPHTQEPLPYVGMRTVLLGFDDEPLAVVETTDVRVARVADVDLAFARDEGEGFETVADWRAGHERFWADHEITDDSLVVAERFRIVERL
jgi:uncharacterized protein YhfF